MHDEEARTLKHLERVAFVEYQLQLFLLEQENKKRLFMTRQGDAVDNITATSMQTGAPTSSGIIPSTYKSNEVERQGLETNLRNVLDGAIASQLDLQKLQEYIELLQKKARHFEAFRKDQAPSRYQVLYRIKQKEVVENRKGLSQTQSRISLPFFDHPEWVQGQGNASRIQSSMPLENFELYLEKNKDVAFIVYRNFNLDSASTLPKPSANDGANARAAFLPKHTSETVRPVNGDLDEAIRTLLGSREEYAELLTEYNSSHELAAPYLFIYHSLQNLEEFQKTLPSPAQTQLSLFSKYVTEQYEDEYTAADSLLMRQTISPECIQYLYKPGDILLSRVDGQYLGYVTTSWPKISHERKMSRMRATTSQNGTRLPIYGSQESMTRSATEEVTIYYCNIKVWQWAFDGQFQRQHKTLTLEISAPEDRASVPTDTKGKNSAQTNGEEHKPGPREKKLVDLNIFPIQYAPAEIVEECRRRGKTFWKCRNRRLVSYRDSETENIQNLVGIFGVQTLSPVLF